MDKDILRPTPQIWDAVAEDYTIELADSDRELASEIMRIFQKNGIKPGARLLELGSGSGHLSACMAQCGYNVTLLDFSAKALEKSRQTFEKYGLEGKFIQGDLLDLVLICPISMTLCGTARLCIFRRKILWESFVLSAVLPTALRSSLSFRILRAGRI